jgi:hypothetical protein
MTETGNYRGFDPDGVAETETDHFMKCPGCGEWFDMRELDQLLKLVHDSEIEICEVRPSHDLILARTAAKGLNPLVQRQKHSSWPALSSI